MDMPAMEIACSGQKCGQYFDLDIVTNVSAFARVHTCFHTFELQN